ncbi:MAG TPA: GxxExxY protein [Candidatus Cloacimonetes bacterium]|nr:GxxExxY protein [Candidatus Cloacimonadota bacterium]
MNPENIQKNIKEDIIFKDECYKIIDCAFTVWKELGYGFLENVYKKALVIELNNKGFNAETGHPVEVFYKGKQISKYFADVMVDRKIILELKAEDKLNLIHQAQVINYLKASRIKVGLLINFGKKKCEFKRLIF